MRQQALISNVHGHPQSVEQQCHSEINFTPAPLSSSLVQGSTPGKACVSRAQPPVQSAEPQVEPLANRGLAQVAHKFLAQAQSGTLKSMNIVAELIKRNEGVVTPVDLDGSKPGLVAELKTLLEQLQSNLVSVECAQMFQKSQERIDRRLNETLPAGATALQI